MANLPKEFTEDAYHPSIVESRRSQQQTPQQRPRPIPRTVPTIVSGGQFPMPLFVAPPPQPRLDIPENSGPAYVVYLGTHNSSGFFRYYRSTNEITGADSIAPSAFSGRLIKSFPTVQAARSTYNECLQTGVLNLLTLVETSETVYIVTKGFEPGVYKSK